uniref:Transmembrane protein n=1 Tax=Medicago truncatula TaxID=3880 RepID=I3SXJ7_MEDTR|nr:unknown [Medicago truncatula]AFK44989.1 unknown [Medicago truncatula]
MSYHRREQCGMVTFKELMCNCAFTVHLYIDGSKSSNSSSPHRVKRICIFFFLFVFGVSLDSRALGLLKELFVIFT